MTREPTNPRDVVELFVKPNVRRLGWLENLVPPSLVSDFILRSHMNEPFHTHAESLIATSID